MTLPSGFIEMAKNLLGDEAESFLSAMSESPSLCFYLKGKNSPGLVGLIISLRMYGLTRGGGGRKQPKTGGAFSGRSPCEMV